MSRYIKSFQNPKSPYHQEALRVAGMIADPADMLIRHGVARWVSNGSVPPEDIIAFAVFLGAPVDEAACNVARSAELSAFLTAYRANPPQVDVAELRAAFGPGARVTNIITGQSWST